MVRKIADAYRAAYADIPRAVWVLSAALFVNRCGSMVLAFFALYMSDRLSFNMLSVGIIFSVYGLGSIVGCYFGGRLTERYGPIRIQIIGLTLSAPMYLVVPAMTTFFGLSVSVFFLSLFTDGIRPANATAIAKFTPLEFQTRAYGLQRMALNLGVSFGPAIGGFLAEVDYVWLFVVDAVSTLAGGIVLLVYFGFREHGDVNESAEEAALNDAGIDHSVVDLCVINQANLQSSVEGDGGLSGKPLVTAAVAAAKKGSPLHDTRFLLFLGLMLVSSIVFFQFHATYPKYLEDHFGMTKPQIGLLYSVNTVIIVLFEMLLLNVVSRWRLLHVIGWGCFLSMAGFGILPLSSAIVMSVVSMLILTAGEMLSMPLSSGFVARRSVGKNQGMYMGWFTMTYALAAVLAPLIGTSYYEWNRDLFWYISLGSSVIVLAGFYGLAKVIADEKSTAKSD